MKTLYILHGWTYDTEKWKPCISELKKRGYACEILRIPGLTAELSAPWDLEDYVKWLSEELNKKTQEDEAVILLGHSNGGRIAAAFAAAYPKKVERLILIDSAGIRPNHFLMKTKRTIFWMIAKVGRKFTKSEKLRSLLYKAARETDYKEAPVVTRETMKNLISADVVSKLPLITSPTLILWGRKDKITPVRDAHIFHKKIKGSSLIVIDTARHAPQYTEPETVANRIEFFLK